MSKLDDTESLLLVGAVGAVAYLAYQAYLAASGIVSTAAGSVGAAATNAGNSIGSSLFNFLNPNAAGSAVTYTATMPDGSITAVNSNSVSASGQTTINGQTYQMYVDPTITSGVNKSLIPVD